MGPALSFLYLLRYNDEEQRKSMKNFAQETIEFAIKKVNANEESEWKEEVVKDVIEHLQSIKLIVGYPKELIDPEIIEDIYSGIKFGDELNESQKFWEISKYYEKHRREPKSSIAQRLTEQLFNEKHEFKYSPIDNTLCNLFC